MGKAQITTLTIIAALVALIAVAALAFTTWGTIGNLESGENDRDRLDVMASALTVSRHVSSLAATGNIASNAGMTRESVVAARTSIASDKSALNRELELK